MAGLRVHRRIPSAEDAFISSENVKSFKMEIVSHSAGSLDEEVHCGQESSVPTGYLSKETGHLCTSEEVETVRRRKLDSGCVGLAVFPVAWSACSICITERPSYRPQVAEGRRVRTTLSVLL